MTRSLTRPARGQGRLIAGVCGALARRFGVSLTMVRVLFVIFGFVGAGELAYIILWVLIPNQRRF